MNVYWFGFARVASLSVLRWTSLTILFALGNSKIMCISCVCPAIGGTTTKCMTRELGEMLDPRIMLKVQVLSGLASKSLMTTGMGHLLANHKHYK